RLAGRDHVSAADRLRQIHDLPVTRTVFHLERPVLLERADVDGGTVAALADLEIEKAFQQWHLVENVVREDRPVQTFPAPAGGILAQPGAEKLQGASEARGLKRRARFDLRRAAVVAPSRVAAQRIDQEAAPRRSARNVAELVLRHARELDEPGRVDRSLDGL